MAFPTTVTTQGTVAVGCGGPFLSSGGNVYVFLKDDTNLYRLRAFKATDPTSSFANAGTDVDVELSTGTLDALAAYQVGDDIHVATMSNTLAGLFNIKYHIFSMASDTWTTSNESVKALYDDGPGIAAIGIALRSDGDVIVLYQGPTVANMGSDRARVYYARREAAVWTVDIAVDNGGATNWMPGGVVTGSSDRMHFFFKDDTADDAYQRTLTSANALETFPASFDTAIFGATDSIVTRGASYVSGANTVIRFPYFDSAANTTSAAQANSADAPTMSVSADITGASLANTAANYASFAANGTTLWHAYNEAGSTDIFTQSNADGAGWSVPASFYTGTVAQVYTNVYTRGGDIVLGIVFSETDPKYHEKVLAAGGNNLSAAAVAVLTGSGAATAAVPVSAAAAATVTMRGASTATANLSASAAATLTLVGEGPILSPAAFSSAAAATLTAQGKATAAADLLAAAAATLTAEGRSTAAAALNAAAAATLTARAEATAAAALLASAAATLTGQGASTASAAWSAAAASTLTVVGEASAQSAAAFESTAAALLTMQGQATAAADLLGAATATLTGQGGATAAGTVEIDATALLSAQGQAIAAADFLSSAVATLSLVGAEIAAAAGDGAFSSDAAAVLTAQGATIAAGAAQMDATATFILVGAGPGAAAQRDYGLPKRRHLKRLAEDDAEIMRIIETALPYLEENHGYH